MKTGMTAIRRFKVLQLRTVVMIVGFGAIASWPGQLAAEGAGAGAAELFRLGVEALEAGRYADAASMFRLSYDMEQRAETICNLATTYDRWSGHDQQALEAYRRCVSEDSSGRFRPHAQTRIRAIQARSGSPARQPSPPSPPSGPQATNVAITWQGTTNTRGCFFFSGPGRLGQRDQLGTQARWVATGNQITMTFSGGQVFSGTRNGQQITLSRRTTYTYQGVWIVTETIQGAFAGATLMAAYNYQECDARRPQTCPGRCSIRSQISAIPRP